MVAAHQDKECFRIFHCDDLVQQHRQFIDDWLGRALGTTDQVDSAEPLLTECGHLGRGDHRVRSSGETAPRLWSNSDS